MELFEIYPSVIARPLGANPAGARQSADTLKRLLRRAKSALLAITVMCQWLIYSSSISLVLAGLLIIVLADLRVRSLPEANHARSRGYNHFTLTLILINILFNSFSV